MWAVRCFFIVSINNLHTSKKKCEKKKWQNDTLRIFYIYICVVKGIKRIAFYNNLTTANYKPT